MKAAPPLLTIPSDLPPTLVASPSRPISPAGCMSDDTAGVFCRYFHVPPTLIELNHIFAKSPSVAEKSAAAISRVVSALDRFDVTGLAFAFNGGKDSVVLLHLVHWGIKWHSLIKAGVSFDSMTVPADFHDLAATVGMNSILSVYFPDRDSFVEMDEFIDETEQRYGLVMVNVTIGFRDGLTHLLDAFPLKGIFLGTRDGDPNAMGQDEETHTSAGWPEFLRLNTIIRWTHHDVWTFLRTADVRFCSLYAKGFTSLGSRANTHPNPSLLQEDGSYLPAWTLVDPDLERAGRMKKL